MPLIALMVFFKIAGATRQSFYSGNVILKLNLNSFLGENFVKTDSAVAGVPTRHPKFIILTGLEYIY
jgi:hypothetical protein